MMLEMTPAELLAEIQLHRSTDERWYLLVEGPSDELALRYHVAEDLWKLHAAGAKETVLGVMRIVAGNFGRHRVAGLVDRDLGVPDPPPGLMLTEFYDLEATALIAGGLATRIVQSNARVGSQQATRIAWRAIRAAAFVGFLRQSAIEKGSSVSMRGIVFAGAAQEPAWKAAAMDIWHQAAKRGHPASPTEAASMASRAATAELADLGLVVNGHDLAAALAFYIREAAVTGPAKGLTGPAVEAQTRAALSCELLRRLSFEVSPTSGLQPREPWSCPCSDGLLNAS
jgi:hypothetical protein